MKTLLLLSGAPGCGKSTFIKNNALEQWVVSPDKLRMLYGTPQLANVNGKQMLTIDNRVNTNRHVWAIVRYMMEDRIQNDSLVILDAQNVRRKNYKDFQKLAEKNGFDVYRVDMMGNITLEELIERNNHRGIASVSEEIVSRSYEMFFTEDPTTQLISQEQALELIKLNPLVSKSTSTHEFTQVVPSSREFSEELRVALNKSKPSEHLENLDLEKYLPELLLLKGAEQNPEYHPEGNSYIHTLQVIDSAAKLKHYIKGKEIEFMYAALLHDIGKHVCTRRNAKGNWTAVGHESYSKFIAHEILKRVGEGLDIEFIENLIEDHMKAHEFLEYREHTFSRLKYTKDFYFALVILGAADKNRNMEAPEALMLSNARVAEKLIRFYDNFD